MDAFTVLLLALIVLACAEAAYWYGRVTQRNLDREPLPRRLRDPKVFDCRPMRGPRTHQVRIGDSDETETVHRFDSERHVLHFFTRGHTMDDHDH